MTSYVCLSFLLKWVYEEDILDDDIPLPVDSKVREGPVQQKDNQVFCTLFFLPLIIKISDAGKSFADDFPIFFEYNIPTECFALFK